MLWVCVFMIMLHKNRATAFLEPSAMTNVLTEFKDTVLGTKRMQVCCDVLTFSFMFMANCYSFRNAKFRIKFKGNI